ncbi:hypothetical protein Q4485_07345 [Granulosicoccaceae sp. 1_MG-2023]|nr:hypothetical protein [Granulosicoccaceae sp. 1_MG-2023]
MSLLFPDVPRDFPFRRWVRIALRTAHLVAIAGLFGGHVFAQPVAALEPWLWAAVLSGFLLFATDLHMSFDALRQVHGLVVIGKVGLLALVPLLWDWRVPLLVAVIVIAAVSSHMPGRWRHYHVF